MVVYECPITKRRGVFSPPGGFDDWARSYFGEFYTWEPDDILPLPCRAVWNLARKPATHAAFVAWVSRNYPAIKIPDPPRPGSIRKKVKRRAV